MSSIVCNRLDFIKINEQSPIVVLEEVLLAHNIKYDKEQLSSPTYIRNIIKSIYSISVFHVNLPLRDNGKRILLQFLGIDNTSENSWCDDDLLSVYNFWQRVKTLPIQSINIDTIGSPTRINKFSYNACLLYSICQRIGLSVNPKISSETMAVMIRLYQSNTIRSSIDIINTFMNTNRNLKDIVSLISLIPSSFYPDIIPPKSEENQTISSRQLLNLISKPKFRNHTKYDRIRPENRVEAVALGCYRFNVNLLYADNPLDVYNCLCSSTSHNDKALREQMELNSLSFITNVVFDPIIPKEFYNTQALQDLIRSEGLSLDELENYNYYDVLQTIYLENNFHYGRFITANNKDQTPILYHNIKDCDPNELITYGVLNGFNVVLTIEEISLMLKNNGNYVNKIPGFNDIFEPRQIIKLHYICNRMNSVLSMSCIKVIESIDVLEQMASNSLNTLVNCYNNGNENIKNNIKDFIEKFFRLSMFMRGWQGIGPYPISKCELKDHQNYVDIRVTDALLEVEQSISLDPNLITIIKSLPIVKYDKGEFIISSSEEEGKTLGERLDILKKGETINNTNSCIRLTSNWFAASSYRFCQVLNITPMFNIRELRYIS